MSRLIIVPSPPSLSEVGHQHDIRVGTTMAKTEMSSSPTSFIMGDPLDDYFRFYLLDSNSIQSARAHFRANAWGMNRPIARMMVVDWIEEHCTLPCLAQPMVGSNPPDWSFYVLDGTLRREQFQNWFNATVVGRQIEDFTLVLPEEDKIRLALEIDESVNQLGRGKALISHLGGTIKVSIFDPTDAVEFKLKWSDYFG